jgi:hypothetical protein
MCSFLHSCSLLSGVITPLSRDLLKHCCFERDIPSLGSPETKLVGMPLVSILPFLGLLLCRLRLFLSEYTLFAALGVIARARIRSSSVTWPSPEPLTHVFAPCLLIITCSGSDHLHKRLYSLLFPNMGILVIRQKAKNLLISYVHYENPLCTCFSQTPAEMSKEELASLIDHMDIQTRLSSRSASLLVRSLIS